MSSIQHVTLEETKTFLKTHPRGKIINVLPPEAYAQQRIPGSINACVFEIVFPERIQELVPDKNTPLLLYGAGHSEDSVVAAEKLAKVGYGDVRIFDDGLDGWKAEALPLEGESPEKALQEPSTLPLFKHYVLLPEHSVIHWIGRNSSHSHDGSLRFSNGELAFSQGTDGDGTGFLSLDMRTIDCSDLAGSKLLPVLLTHLKSEDFFNVLEYPKAELHITRLASLPHRSVTRPTHHLEGVLHLLDKKETIECDVSLRNLPKNQLGLFCRYTMDRTRWGVKYGSARFYRFLGMHSVDDDINLDISLVFQADEA